MAQQTKQDFWAVRYWPQLDGLRTLSILLVLIIHMGDQWWIPYKGALGVVLFFVISGFLITSLLIREERRKGKVAIGKFYIRRVFRIAPMYYLALITATALVFAFNLGSGRDSFLGRIGYLASFNGDFAIYGTFVHAWSIGIEEKFYVLWPLLAFGLLGLKKHRGWIVAVLLPLCAICAYVPGLSYLGIYTAIVAGCALAIAMHSERGYAVVRTLASPAIGTTFFVLAVLAFVFDSVMPFAEESGLAHVPFALAVTLTFPFVLIGNSWLTRGLSWKVLAFIGTRTYGIYLFHPFCIDVINRIIPDSQTEPLPALARFVAAAILSYLVAEVLFRLVERPFNTLGHRLANGKTGQSEPDPRISDPAARVAD